MVGIGVGARKRVRPPIEPIEPESFLAGATIKCMAHVQLARLGLVRCQTQSWRSFSIDLIVDCDRMIFAISRVAARQDLPVPDSLESRYRDAVRDFGNETTADFDTSYGERLMASYHNLVELFKRGQTIKVPEISALASLGLAKFEAHMKIAGRLLDNTGTLGYIVGVSQPRHLVN